MDTNSTVWPVSVASLDVKSSVEAKVLSARYTSPGLIVFPIAEFILRTFPTLSQVKSASPPRTPLSLNCTCVSAPPGDAVIPRDEVAASAHFVPFHIASWPKEFPISCSSFFVPEVDVPMTSPPKGPMVTWFCAGATCALAVSGRSNASTPSTRNSLRIRVLYLE